MRVETVSALDLTMGGEAWDFAIRERPSIDAYWGRIAADNPRLWNGNVLICMGAEVERQTLLARFATTDYASFVAWRDWGWPDRSVSNCFAAPAIFSSDGALVFGVMGQDTLNAGLTYPPSGSLEPRDVRSDGTVDALGSMAVELAEETGLDIADARRGEMMAIFDEQRLAIVQALHFPLSFAEIQSLFLAHIQAHAAPELQGLSAIRSRSQIDSTMPGFAQEIIRYFFNGGEP